MANNILAKLFIIFIQPFYLEYATKTTMQHSPKY